MLTLVEGKEEEILASRVPAGAEVLDCGCGEGAKARALGARGCRVDGVELDPARARAAAAACREVFGFDLGAAAGWAALGDRRYDAVVFSHVLEHLTAPTVALREAEARLRPGGAIVILLPNVAHWTARWTLARGRWPTADEGLFDRTHVRFYTPEGAAALVRDAGVELREAVGLTIGATGGALRRGVIALARRAAPPAFALTTLLVAGAGATPGAGSRPG